ncbi:MAG: hypothetical protein KDK30_04560 [Leptospiraceae bacterium]|nr:hypothetical protein [Leptospiraceae bacterium]MCB1314552.1 hypothetical protein [Leptospiraceae bacterium]
MGVLVEMQEEAPGIFYLDIAGRRYYLIEKDGRYDARETLNGKIIREQRCDDYIEGRMRIDLWSREYEPQEVKDARKRLRSPQ